ncbi:hypothetical protein BaRGS_00007460 [Batillaria attramentaria]|uniref:Uncharacterized protein n=1 Tax=Batillaria attramentaria TaxID=370345 RepID=A0ABD0LP70_9CAEN
MAAWINNACTKSRQTLTEFLAANARDLIKGQPQKGRPWCQQRHLHTAGTGCSLSLSGWSQLPCLCQCCWHYGGALITCQPSSDGQEQRHPPRLMWAVIKTSVNSSLVSVITTDTMNLMWFEREPAVF